MLFPLYHIIPRRILQSHKCHYAIHPHISTTSPIPLFSSSACAHRQWVEVRRENCHSVCWASGDPHYRTFDGAAYDFMGACNYIMVKHANYMIKSENTPCGSTGKMEDS